MYLSYDTTNWSPEGKGRARRALADINPNSYLQSSSQSTTDDPPHHTPLTPSITSSSIVGLASLASHPSIGPTPQPRINTLPTEILTSIFILCLPMRSDIPTSAVAPLLLCHVCDYWRRLAKATPFLWLDLDLGEVRPGIMRRRVVVRDDDDEEVMVNAYMAETLGDAPGTSTVDPTVTTNATSLLRDYSYSRLRTAQLKLHTLALPFIAEQFASLSHPLPLRSLKLDVSRFRWDVKTDWERRTRNWVVERLVPDPVSGETRRVTIHQYRYRNVSSSSIPGEEEEGYYYELISARDVLESVLFAGGGFVAESVGRLDVSIDDLDDLPRVQVRASPLPYATIPPFIPGTFIPTLSSSTSSPLPVLTTSYTFVSLHTLTLTLPHLTLPEFDFTLTGQWNPLYQQLRGVVDSARRKWGFLRDALDSRSPGSDIPIDSGGGGRPLEGYALAFCHPRIVPNLRKVEVDAPWAALVPGSYTSPSSRRRGQHSDALPPSSGLANLVALYTGLLRTHAWTGFDALSIVPYAQLTELTIVEARPVPAWLLRALLVECVALKVGRVGIVKFTPPPPSTSLGAGGIGIIGGGLPLGGGVDVNVNGAGAAADEDLGMNAECYRAFGGDPVRRALSTQALGPQRNSIPGTFVYPNINQDPIPPTAASGTDDETLWRLPHLEELTLRFGCTPRGEEGAWVKRRREFERERWGPAAGAASVFQRQVGTWGTGTGSGQMEYGKGEAEETTTWRDVVVLDGERVPERVEEDILEFGLGGFEFGRECVVRVGFV